MKVAIKVRKTRNGDGAIYKLEPPIVKGDRNIHYVIFKSSKSKAIIEGFVSWPPFTTITSAIPNTELADPFGGFIKTTSFFYDQNINQTPQKAFLNIGYKVQTKKEQA